MKRILSAVLIVISLLGMLTFGTTAAMAKSVDFSEARQVLQSVGIISSVNNDKLSEEVSRADFAIYAANIINVPAGHKSDKCYYYDVPADHWALDSVNALAECGALTVGADRMFNGASPITLQQSVKIMLSLAGYSSFAEARGGFPDGYMKIAYDQDLLDGISQTGTFTLKDAIVLLYNTVNMKMLDTYAIQGDHVKYTTNGETLLSVYHDVYSVEAYVTGVHGISLSDAAAPEKNQILLGDTVYSVGNSDMFPYLGMYVKAYYYDNEASYDEVIYISPIDYKNEYVDINLDDVNGFDSDSYTLSYQDKNDKNRNHKLSYGVIIARNGRMVSRSVAQELSSFGQGSLRLIDTERDGIYDIALISEYNDMVIGHIDLENQIIYDKYDPSINFCLKEENGKAAMLYTAGGASSKIEALSIGGIVTIFKSDNYARAYYSDTTVKGKLSQIITDEDGTVITIASRFGDSSADYRLDKQYLTRSEEKLSTKMQVSAKLDIYGRVAYMDIENSEMMYGYLVNQGRKGAISSTFQLKVLTDDGEMRILDCADKVIVDGNKEKSADDIETAIRRGKADPSDFKTGQVIRFSLDDEGKVKEIDTTYVGEGGNDKLFVTHEWGTRRYSSRSVRFDTTAMVGANTVIFGIPVIDETDDPDVLADDITLANDDDFGVLTTSFFTNSTSYKVETYKTRLESGFEDVVVYQGSGKKSITTSTDMFVISSIRYELTEDGDYAESVYGCSAGAMLSYRMAPGYSMKDEGYESGDIVRIAVNGKGEAMEALCVYKYMGGIDPNTNAWIELEDGQTYADVGYYWDNGRFKTISSANPWSSFTIAYANVVSTNDNVLKLSRTGYTLNDVDEALRLSSLPVIVIYDKQAGREKISIGNLSDLVPGVSAGESAVKAFVRTEESNLRWIVIYK